MDKYRYKVSVVMAVYNVEEFIREAIDSLIAQKLGFENIQLILIDDGSPDKSGDICDEYAIRFPNNIVVVHKKNEGQAQARVDGIALCQGKYISFFDPDDILTPETFLNMVTFFDTHYSEIDVVAMPLYLFGSTNGPHPLNRKFAKGTRVIDLQKEYDCIQLSLASVLIKKEIAYLIEADREIVTAEDAKELMKILLIKQKIGVVSEAQYKYRKRTNSTVGGAQSRKGWYNTYLINFPQYIFDFSIKHYGNIPKFVQYTIMYDLQWKFCARSIPANILSQEEEDEYKKRLFSILTYIDDEIIWGQRQLNVEQKLFLVQKKHPELHPKIMSCAESPIPMLTFNNMIIREIGRFQTQLNFCEICSDYIELEGRFLVPSLELPEPILLVRVGGEDISVDLTRYDEEIYSVDTCIAIRRGFKVRIPVLSKPRDIMFVVRYGEQEASVKSIVWGKYFPVSARVPYSHYYKNGIMLRMVSGRLQVQKANRWLAKKIEIKYLLHLLTRKDKAAKNAFVARCLVHVLRPIVPKNIWLITDKADRADDNGEAFFRYCIEHKTEVLCSPVFAVGKSSSDYQRMKKVGPVIPYMSWRYKLCHLLATHTISAYSHDEISLPFFDYSHYYSDLIQRNKIVFLQHGIIKDDLSISLNRNHKNFSIFVTSVRPEYQSVLDCNYGYTKKQVALTGLPRYDRLYNDTKKIITVMPTWRRNLFGSYDSGTSRWSLLPGFEESVFFQFYSNLLNSEKLHTVAEREGYTIQFLIHPTLFPYLDYFVLDSRVNVLKADVAYRDVFAQSALILTDYSSVAFDMAYLQKPVLYTHFDSNHYAEGYFDYERDGFGEVEYTLEDTINRIIEYMENECKLKDEYRQRIDTFFAFDDKNNCQRVYEKIVEMDK